MSFIALCALCRVTCAPEDFSIADESILGVARADYHAYENAWSVYFTKTDSRVFDVLIVELCRPPCASAAPPASTLQDCDALVATLNSSRWHNEYVASQLRRAGNSSERRQSVSSFCGDMQSAGTHAAGTHAAAPLQVRLNHILSDSDGAALVRLKPPLAMVVYNDDDLVRQWTTPLLSDLVVSLTVRLTQVWSWNTIFSVHTTVMQIDLSRPTMHGALTFRLQNPCTAVGLSAPPFGGVASVNISGRPRCVWSCVGNMIRTPWNSVPPTPEQLNASHPEYAKLAVKYACLPVSAEWTSTFFEFKLETNMIPTDDGYAQSLYDALDSMALAVQQGMAAQGIAGTVLLAISDNLYQPVSFDVWARQLHLAACASAECNSAVSEVRNPNFIYQRRRLLRRRLLSVQSLSSLLIEGVFVASEPERVAEAPKPVAILAVLRSEVESSVAVQASTDTSLQIKGVADMDFSKIVEFKQEPVSPHTTPAPSAPADQDSQEIDKMLSTASFVGVVLCAVVAAVFVLMSCPRVCCCRLQFRPSVKLAWT